MWVKLAPYFILHLKSFLAKFNSLSSRKEKRSKKSDSDESTFCTSATSLESMLKSFNSKEDELNESLLSSHDNENSAKVLNDDNDANDGNKAFVIERGVSQPSSCRDWPWALLFCSHVGCIISLVFLYGVSALKDSVSPKLTSDDYRQGYEGYLYICMICVGCAFCVSMICIGIMMRFTASIITFAFWFSLIFSFSLSIGLFYLGEHGLGAVNLVSFIFSLFYSYGMKKRIPFSAANLKVGLRAVKHLWSVLMVTFTLVWLAGVYITLWTIALIGIYEKTAGCKKGETCDSDPNLFFIMLMMLAFFWTAHVIENTIHVTVAGTVGSWWFDPENESSSSCTNASDSLFRAMTYSFGSICLGSIFVTIIQTIRNFTDFEAEGNTLCCVLAFVERHVDRLFQKFNKWGFIYVGVYGYSFRHSSKCTIEIFRQRGWSSIMNDDLVSSGLGLMSLVIGSIIGLLAMLLSNNKQWIPGNEFEFVKYYMFVVGFFIGLVLSSIMFGVLECAANTVLVLFAEAPLEFATNHRASCDEMRCAWREAYPELSGSFYIY